MAKSDKKVWIVVEPLLFIHTGNFLGAILRHQRVSEDFEVILVTSQVSVAFDGVSREMTNEFGDRFKIHEYAYPQLTRNYSYFDTTIRAFFAMREAAKLARQKSAEEVTLFYADHFVKLLGLPFMARFFGALKNKVDSIFFNTRCFRQDGFKNKIHAGLVIRGLRTGFFRKMHFLDHGVCEKVREKLPKRFRETVVRGVDPWRPLPASGEARNSDRSSSRLTLFTFGAHSLRKGTLTLLKMLKDFPEETKNYELLIVGEIRDEIREEFDQLLTEIPRGGAQVRVEARFVEEERMGQYFRQADIVTCPYVNFHGSSNVVIRAAAAGLPVVVPSFGFLQDLVAEGGLGELAKENTPPGILKAIQKIEVKLRDEDDRYKEACSRYANFHAETRFPESLASL
ncbi:MAG: glycosyltransferase [Akkermansiaceae bacterium]